MINKINVKYLIENKEQYEELAQTLRPPQDIIDAIHKFVRQNTELQDFVGSFSGDHTPLSIFKVGMYINYEQLGDVEDAEDRYRLSWAQTVEDIVGDGEEDEEDEESEESEDPGVVIGGIHCKNVYDQEYLVCGVLVIWDAIHHMCGELIGRRCDVDITEFCNNCRRMQVSLSPYIPPRAEPCSNLLVVVNGTIFCQRYND